MISTKIDPTMPTRRLLSGLHVPDFGDDTAPLDVTHLHDDPTPAPKQEQEPSKQEQEPARERPRPEPPTPSPEPVDPVEAFRPEKPTPTPAPVSTSTTTSSPARARQPEPQRQPLKPPSAPTFWGSRALEAVYWIAILTGAIGQVIFFGGLFDLGWPGYAAAAIIATTAETIMISAGDTALKFFTNGVPGKRWWIFLAVSIVAALTAAALNVTHWWGENKSMAVLFGGIAMLGYILHITDGFVRALSYREAKAAYEAEVKRREDDAAKAATPAPAPVPAPRTASPARVAAPKAKSAAKSTSKAKGKGKGKVATKQIAVQLGVERRADTPAALARVLHDSGYAPSPESTIKSWCREIKAQLAATQ